MLSSRTHHWANHLVWSSLALGCLGGTGSLAWGQDPPSDPPAPTEPAPPPPSAPPAPGSTPEQPAPETSATMFPEIKEAVEFFNKGLFGDAMEKLKVASENHPELGPARLVYAEFLIKGGQAPQGRIEIEQVATELPDEPRVHMMFGALGLAEGRWTDALLEYEVALEKGQKFAFVDEKRKNEFIAKCHLGLGTVYERRKDWKAARAEFEKWVEFDPKSGPARQRLAQAIFFCDDIDKAMEELKQAKADTPGLSSAETALGSFYAAKNEPEKAEEMFKKGIESEPTNVLSYQTYAQWLFTRSRANDSRDVIKSGLEALPASKPLRLLKAMLARHNKLYEEAELELEDLLKELPNDGIIKNELALVLAEQPDTPKVQRAFDLAKQNVQATQQRSADALATLGWVYYRLGQIDQAERVLAASLRMSAGNTKPETIYYYANILAEKGANNDVRKLLEQVIKADAPFPQKEDAKQWLSRLSASTP